MRVCVWCGGDCGNGGRGQGAHICLPPLKKNPQRFPDGGGVVMNEPLIAEPSRHW